MKLFISKNTAVELNLLKQKRERYLKLDDILIEEGNITHTYQSQLHHFYLAEITAMEKRIVEISPKMTKIK